MAASLQAAATLMQPTKVGVAPARSTVQLRSSQSLSKAFGVDAAGARLTCSLQTDLKDLAQKCVDATKIAGFALATSALVVSVCFLPLTHLSFCFKLLIPSTELFCMGILSVLVFFYIYVCLRLTVVVHFIFLV